jgi:hypothetical protein
MDKKVSWADITDEDVSPPSKYVPPQIRNKKIDPNDKKDEKDLYKRVLQSGSSHGKLH